MTYRRFLAVCFWSHAVVHAGSTHALPVPHHKCIQPTPSPLHCCDWWCCCWCPFHEPAAANAAGCAVSINHSLWSPAASGELATVSRNRQTVLGENWCNKRDTVASSHCATLPTRLNEERTACKWCSASWHWGCSLVYLVAWSEDHDCYTACKNGCFRG